MQDEIIKLFHSKDPLDEEGRLWLLDRQISIHEAQKAGVCTANGNIYFIYQRDGKAVRWKARNMKDKKKQFMNTLTDEESKDFKMPFFSQVKCPTSRNLVICEGECDCLVLKQLGVSNCVSLPHGAGSVESSFKTNYEFLQQFDLIYIAFDMDAAGEEAARKAQKLLSPSKYRRINFPAKDANDWIKSEPDIDSQDLLKLMENASRIGSPCITNILDVPHDYYDEVDVGISTGYKKLDLIIGGMRLGEVTVVTADTGAGKSTFSFNLFKNLAEHGFPIWINSYELDPKMVNRKLASIVLQKRMKLLPFKTEDIQKYKEWLRKYNCFLNVVNNKVDITILRNMFEMASLVHDVKFILLDHFDYIHANGKKDTSLENIDDAIRGIHALAMEFKVGVVLVVHPKQVQDKKELTMADLKGSSAIKQYADNIIVLTRMDRLDENDKLRVKVRVWKNRLLGIESFFFMRYVEEIDSYTETY